MAACPKAEVWIGSALEVEPIRVLESGRISIRSAGHREDALSLCDPFVAQLDVIQGNPSGGQLCGVVATEQLFDGCLQVAEMAAQPAQLLGPTKEDEHAVYNHRPRIDFAHNQQHDAV